MIETLRSGSQMLQNEADFGRESEKGESSSSSSSSDVESPDEDEMESAAKCIDLESDPTPSGFVVAVTTAKIRRLHYVGNCGRRPGEHYRTFEVYGAWAPDPTKYDKRCRQCFPEEVDCLDLDLQEVPEDSDSSGSTTHSSGAD